ncbi:hypothetical protein [Nocardiopsis potens]|uniref:hypothetical protein n=1 Tax=Nocardiopsis potens TaxID=1246458 RepID=UPI000345BEB8|nr:hypothetical protein [Nocardiopsis potens]
MLIERVMEISGAGRTAVLRVLAGGGTSASDWGIAQAVERVTGRRAADVMWGHTSDFDAPVPEVTNPHATYDPSTTIYAEDSHGLVTDTPETRATEEDAAEDGEVTGAAREPVTAADGIEDLDADDLVRGYAADLALIRGWSPARAEAEVRYWADAPAGTRVVRAVASLVADAFDQAA